MCLWSVCRRTLVLPSLSLSSRLIRISAIWSALKGNATGQIRVEVHLSQSIFLKQATPLDRATKDGHYVFPEFEVSGPLFKQFTSSCLPSWATSCRRQLQSHLPPFAAKKQYSISSAPIGPVAGQRWCLEAIRPVSWPFC